MLAIREQLLAGFTVGASTANSWLNPKAAWSWPPPFAGRAHCSLDYEAPPAGLGTRRAVLEVAACLKRHGEARFTIKLDVRKYFASIDHAILLRLVCEQMPDRSLEPLLLSLLKNHSEYARRGKGIPIGNLTSQLFANWYLAGVDSRVASWAPEVSAFRYMDDYVLVGRSKSAVLDAADAAVAYAQQELALNIPIEKRVPLGNAPVPFLGYLLDHRGIRVLGRNRRKFANRIRALRREDARPSRIAQVAQSYEAWGALAMNSGRLL